MVISQPEMVDIVPENAERLSCSRGFSSCWISLDFSTFEASHYYRGSSIRSDADSAVHSWNQKTSATLAGEPLQLSRNSHSTPHPYPSRDLHVTVRKGRVFMEDFTSEGVQYVYPLFSYLDVRAVLSSHLARTAYFLPNG